MPPPPTPTPATFPIIDLLSPDSPPLLHSACKTHGFFYIKNHGIPPGIFRAALEQCKAFFALPLEAKEQCKGKDHSQGYQGMGTERLNAQEQRHNCTQEGLRLSLAPDSFAALQRWPDVTLLPKFREVMTKYHEEMEGVAYRVTQLLLTSLRLAPNYLHKAFHPASATTRLLHYAPVASKPEEGLFGCGAHTDWGCLTLLVTEEEGLEVCVRASAEEGNEEESSRWIPVPPSTHRYKHKHHTPGEEWLLICNLGDLLQRWTNDTLKSTPHRVVNREGKDRYSIPFFYSAHPETVVQVLPPFVVGEEEAQGEEEGGGGGGMREKYPPIVVREYIKQKYASITREWEEAEAKEKSG